MPTSFKDYMLELAPSWLRNPQGGAYVRAVADVKDWLLQRTKEAVKARFVLLGPNDARLQVGSERQIPKAAAESYATYAVRLQKAWETWPWAGTARGVLTALRDSGYPGVALVVAKGYKYELDGDGNVVVTNLGIGTEPTYWSRFWVYFPSAAFPAGWSGTPPSSSSDEAKFIISLVKKWKAGHARFDRVVFDMGGPIWGFSTWGSFTWGGAAAVIWDGPF